MVSTLTDCTPCDTSRSIATRSQSARVTLTLPGSGSGWGSLPSMMCLMPALGRVWPERSGRGSCAAGHAALHMPPMSGSIRRSSAALGRAARNEMIKRADPILRRAGGCLVVGENALPQGRRAVIDVQGAAFRPGAEVRPVGDQRLIKGRAVAFHRMRAAEEMSAGRDFCQCVKGDIRILGGGVGAQFGH